VPTGRQGSRVANRLPGGQEPRVSVTGPGAPHRGPRCLARLPARLPGDGAGLPLLPYRRSRHTQASHARRLAVRIGRTLDSDLRFRERLARLQVLFCLHGTEVQMPDGRSSCWAVPSGARRERAGVGAGRRTFAGGSIWARSPTRPAACCRRDGVREGPSLMGVQTAVTNERGIYRFPSLLPVSSS